MKKQQNKTTKMQISFSEVYLRKRDLPFLLLPLRAITVLIMDNATYQN